MMKHLFKKLTLLSIILFSSSLIPILTQAQEGVTIVEENAPSNEPEAVIVKESSIPQKSGMDQKNTTYRQVPRQSNYYLSYDRLKLEIMGHTLGIMASLLYVSALGNQYGKLTKGASFNSFALLTAIGSSAFMSAGIYLGGELGGGDGNYWYTLLGTSVGLGLGIGSIYASKLDSVSLVSLILLPLIGGIVGYEVSYSVGESKKQLALAPNVGITENGFNIGVSGTF